MSYGQGSERFFSKSCHKLIAVHGRRLRTSVLTVILISSVSGLPGLLATIATPSGQQTDKWKIRTDDAIHVAKTASPAKGESFPFRSMSAKALRAAGVSTAVVPKSGGGVHEYIVMNVEFTSAAARIRFRQRGATVFTAFDRFADMFVSSEQVEDSILRRTDVLWAERISRVSAPPTPAPERGAPTRQVAERIVRGGVGDLTGRGVIIALVDSGIDFRNADFVSYDADGRPTSRLLYLWDTTSAAFDSHRIGTKPPLSYPNGASLGTLYTQAQLTEDLRSSTKRILATDLNGHGTACASIAAGNGQNDRGTNGLKRTETIGVAPGADIIGIRIGRADGPENNYLLNAAVGWLDQVAGPKPLVVSFSFGGHRGGHDGQLIEERELNARFPLTKRSRAIVVAAGNEGSDSFHSEATFSGQDAARLVRWQTPDENYMRLYFSSADDDIVVAPAGDTKLKVVTSWINPFTHQRVAIVKVQAGNGGLWLYDDSGRQNTANIYMREADFASDSVSYNTLVGTPGTASTVLTVGSYDWNDLFHQAGKVYSLSDVCGSRRQLVIGGLSCYSSPGYSRNGTIKPEIISPGGWYEASYAKKLDGTGPEGWLVDSTGKYVAMNGTSAATPYTAGIIALMLQKRPTLTFGEIRRLLTTNASKDDLVTGPVPNPNWGYGKLDLAAAERILEALSK